MESPLKVGMDPKPHSRTLASSTILRKPGDSVYVGEGKPIRDASLQNLPGLKAELAPIEALLPSDMNYILLPSGYHRREAR